MTRNRDDFCITCAIRNGTLGALAILVAMTVLGHVIAANKADAAFRDAAMGNVTFTDHATPAASVHRG